jgi:tetratricopeptide (TPR) repeat protein
MFRHIISAIILTCLTANCASAQPGPRRVALVIGQNAYTALDRLVNPKLDATRMAKLLHANGFDVIACDGKNPGCFDLTRDQLIEALATFGAKANGADLALIHYAGHGLESNGGNVLAPIDATIDCATLSVGKSLLVSDVLAAAGLAKHKVIILDACRDQPLGKVCPPLALTTPQSFKRIEAGDMRNLLLVSSTQFGQQALDGADGQHSPFAAALFAALDANPRVYFDQIMNQVAKATYDHGQSQKFTQIPGRVVGGEAPADCLAGKDCVGDMRMSALASQIDILAAESKAAQADASGVRNIIAADEKARGNPYTPEERAKRISELGLTLASIGSSGDPLRREARRMIDKGNVSGGQAKLDEALDAEEKAANEAEKLVAEKRKAAARNARDLAVLSRATNVAKAVDYYARATKLDPSDAQVWDEYARAAIESGHLNQAKTAFENAALKAQDAKIPKQLYWATLGLGDVALAQGNTQAARKFYEQASAIIEPLANADTNNRGWQRDLSVVYNKLGHIYIEQGDLSEALVAIRKSVAIRQTIAKADSTNVSAQRDLSIASEALGDVYAAQGNLTAALSEYRSSLERMIPIRDRNASNTDLQRVTSVTYNKIGNMLLAQGQLADAIQAFHASLDIMARLTKFDPGNRGWQRDHAVSYNKVGDMYVKQGNLADALKAYQASFEISAALTKIDPGNASWRRDLSVSQDRTGDVLRMQGNLPEAIKTFTESLAIRQELATADPGNPGSQRDLSVSFNKIGDVLVTQRNLPQALTSFRDSLAITNKLAKTDSGNSGWQRDLAVSHSKVANVLAQQGERSQARAEFVAGRDIIAALVAASPTDAQLPKDLVYFDAQIAKLKPK